MELEWSFKFLNWSLNTRHIKFDFHKSYNEQNECLCFSDIMTLYLKRNNHCGFFVVFPNNRKIAFYFYKDYGNWLLYDVKSKKIFYNVLITTCKHVFQDELSFSYNNLPILSGFKTEINLITLDHSESYNFI